MNEEEILSKNIRKYRESLHLTQGELAEMINYSDKTISKWERGESVPDVFTINKLAKIFRVSIETLLSDTTKTTKTQSQNVGLWQKFTLQIIIISVTFAYIIAYLILCLATGHKLPYLYILGIFYAASISLAIFIYIRCFKHRLDLITISLFIWFFYLGLIVTLLPACGTNILSIVLLPILSQVFVVFYCNFRNKVIKARMLKKISKSETLNNN